ncbi:hypothetical protein [Streptomyces sp. NPDC005385]|uniref:hypothetical protein n=1 Tax=Streptomyces sp. NPDC005385 TaxID=3157039 RepID=UPI0033B7DFB5
MSSPEWLLKPVKRLEEDLNPKEVPTWYASTREKYAVEFTDTKGKKHVSEHGSVTEAAEDFKRTSNNLLPGEGSELIRYSRTVVGRHIRRRETSKPEETDESE